MKKSVRNVALLLLGAAIELGMLATPLAGIAYAEEKPAALHAAVKGNPFEIKDNHDRDRQPAKDGQRDFDRDHGRDRDHDRDRDRDHDRDHGWQGNVERLNQHRWDRWAFERHLALYREWLVAHQADAVNQSPVNAVMSAADVLGFNVNSDTFTLISQNAFQAVVQVMHDGETFSITLNNANGLWTVAEMVQV